MYQTATAKFNIGLEAMTLINTALKNFRGVLMPQQETYSDCGNACASNCTVACVYGCKYSCDSSCDGGCQYSQKY